MQKYIFQSKQNVTEKIFIAIFTKNHYLCSMKLEFSQLYYQPLKSQHHE